MTGDDGVPPAELELGRPAAPRVHDRWLGGSSNWSIDRELADRMVDDYPSLPDIALASRVFNNRAVRHLYRLGVRQFVDIGSGEPIPGCTHEVVDEFAAAEGRAPDARVVYVDRDAIVVAHTEVLLDRQGDQRRHAVVNADLRDPDGLWAAVLDTEQIDLDKPVALLLFAVLHHHQPGPDGDDVSARSVARFRELLPPGSFLALSHVTSEGVPAEVAAQLVTLARSFEEESASNVVTRGRTEISALLDGFELLEPGWAWGPDWHPEETGPGVRPISLPTPGYSLLWAAVGRVP
ncbi:SAM-dependent methyltransferase [Actinophytocola xanthii]|nr:SAM-dependent methyltransferase [Actinophytocola xanthii]